MGVEAAVISAIATIYSVSEQQRAAEGAKRDRERAHQEQVKAQQEQKAQNAAELAAQQRQQIREERIKRARIIQASENTGVGTSSGVAGGTGGLSTQLGAGLGQGVATANRAAAIGDLNQSAAGFLSSAENKIMQANQWGQVAGLGMSIFQGAGGFSAFKPSTQPPAPVVDRSFRSGT